METGKVPPDGDFSFTPRQLEWLGWLKLAAAKRITQKQAAERMHVSERWVRKLLHRMKLVGDRAVVHGLRGKPSNRRIPDPIRSRVIELLKTDYKDFGPTLAAAYLSDQHQIRVSKETVRQWMIQEKLWYPGHYNRLTVTSWQPRKERWGELVHWCIGEYDWLNGGPGSARYLMAMIGDATSRALARFATADTLEENLELLREYLKRWGRPLEFRFGRLAIHGTPPEVVVLSENARPAPAIQRIFRKLGIAWTPIQPPMPSGRVQHFFSAAAKGLCERLRKNRITTVEAANKYLNQIWLPNWNSKMTVTAAGDAHRPVAAPTVKAAINETQQVKAEVAS